MKLCAISENSFNRHLKRKTLLFQAMSHISVLPPKPKSRASIWLAAREKIK